VAPVIVAEDEEDAIRIANDTEYGLSGAVHTGSLERGLRVARQISSSAESQSAARVRASARVDGVPR
jgi:acyl-CoA reductase-like NAD-dependent aldehyde dehydrogenase